jgi:hypothetical protein
VLGGVVVGGVVVVVGPVPDGVQPDRETTTEVVPSRTVALQSVDLKPDVLNLNRPSLSALPFAVLSVDVTVIVAFARAPLPSIDSVPDELSDAFVTLTAADA